MGSIRVAIVGVGNCASSLVQGVDYYKDADPGSRVPGLMHVQFSPDHVRDVEFVAEFEVDDKKVGRDMALSFSATATTAIYTLALHDAALRPQPARQLRPVA